MREITHDEILKVSDWAKDWYKGNHEDRDAHNQGCCNGAILTFMWLKDNGFKVTKEE